MKYKILLSGKNTAIIDDFFTHLSEDFESQTTSMRHEDVLGHIKYFKPDAFVLCLKDTDSDKTKTIITFKNNLDEFNIPIIIIGNQEECDDFEKKNYQTSELTLVKPIPVRGIRDKIVHFLQNRHSVKKKEPTQATYDPEEDGNIMSSLGSNLDEVDNILEDLAKLMSEETLKPTPAKKHILVVDDDPMMLKLIKEQLKEHYAVGTAINGNLALNFLKKKKTDLIILDYEMPGENGAQVLEKIRKNEETAHLPVIFLTGMNDKNKIQHVLELKPQGYLLKPIESEKMLEIIKKTIG